MSPVRMPEASVRACRHCGCTEDNACPGGCAWVSNDECSECRPDLVFRIVQKRQGRKAERRAKT